MSTGLTLRGELLVSGYIYQPPPTRCNWPLSDNFYMHRYFYFCCSSPQPPYFSMFFSTRHVLFLSGPPLNRKFSLIINMKLFLILLIDMVLIQFYSRPRYVMLFTLPLPFIIHLARAIRLRISALKLGLFPFNTDPFLTHSRFRLMWH